MSTETASVQPRKPPYKLLAGVGLLALGVAAWMAVSGRSNPSVRPATTATAPVDVNAVRAKADAGDAEAIYQLGAIYAKGEGVKQDYKEAARLYQAAAGQGDPKAQFALGELYEVGQGVPVNDREAARWYQSAAEQGLPGAQYSLAVLYVTGKGVKQDAAQAVEWYKRAAAGGNGYAQYTLGLRCLEGDGVPADKVESYKWLSLAVTQDIPDAANARDGLKKKLSRQELAEAKRRIEAFTPAPQRTPVATKPGPAGGKPGR